MNKQTSKEKEITINSILTSDLHCKFFSLCVLDVNIAGCDVYFSAYFKPLINSLKTIIFDVVYAFKKSAALLVSFIFFISFSLFVFLFSWSHRASFVVRF